MKYIVVGEKRERFEKELEVPLPFGNEDPELTDKMVRKEARTNGEALKEQLGLPKDSILAEVWRDGVRIYPRALRSETETAEAPEPIAESSKPDIEPSWPKGGEDD